MKTFPVNSGYLDMWPKTLLTLALVLALGTLAPKSVRATGHWEWRDIDSREHIILFSPPFMGSWTPGITVRVRDRTVSRAEWLCWRNFRSVAANACITFQKQRKSFRYMTATYALKWYSPLKDVKHTIIRQSKKIDHELAKFDTIIFTYDISNSTKHCVVFTAFVSGRRHLIDGWYCAPVNEPLSESLVQKIISTIGLKGRHEPARVTYNQLTQITREGITAGSSGRFEGQWAGLMRCGSCDNCIGPLEKNVRIDVKNSKFDIIPDASYMGVGVIDDAGNVSIEWNPDTYDWGTQSRKNFRFVGKYEGESFVLSGERGPRSCDITLSRVNSPED